MQEYTATFEWDTQNEWEDVNDTEMMSLEAENLDDAIAQAEEEIVNMAGSTPIYVSVMNDYDSHDSAQSDIDVVRGQIQFNWEDYM